jgi:hypothetical protein
MEYDMPATWAEDIESRILSAARELAVKAGIQPAGAAPK